MDEHQHGPVICQMVSETFNPPFYTNCVECYKRTCPVNRIFKILKDLAPEAIRELREEAEMIRIPRRLT